MDSTRSDSTRSLPLTIISGLLIALFATVLPTLFQSPKAAVLYCVPNAYLITTLDPAVPHAKCFRVRDGIFTEVLAESPLPSSSLATEKEEDVVMLDGYVLPGIIESHGHILQYGEMLESVLLYDAKSVDEVVLRIKSFLQEHAGEGYGSREKWIRGIGWDQAFFNGVMPTAVRIPRIFIILITWLEWGKKANVIGGSRNNFRMMKF